MAEGADFRVILSEDAIEDLSDIGRWIAERSDVDTANAYVARIQAACDRLSYFPNRGTPRFGVVPGLRTFTFERRDIVCYRVVGDEVIILRVIHGARDFAAAFKA
jgi:toxin ParE1/3/4